MNEFLFTGKNTCGKVFAELGFKNKDVLITQSVALDVVWLLCNFPVRGDVSR